MENCHQTARFQMEYNCMAFWSSHEVLKTQQKGKSMSYYEVIFLGLVCLAAPWLGRLGGYELTRKPFDMVGIAGMFFLLAAAFGLGIAMVDALRGIGSAFETVSFVMGWIALAAGAIWTTIDLLRLPTHTMSRSKA